MLYGGHGLLELDTMVKQRGMDVNQVQEFSFERLREAVVDLYFVDFTDTYS